MIMGREGVRTHPCGMDVLQGVHFSVVSRRVLSCCVVSCRVVSAGVPFGSHLRLSMVQPLWGCRGGRRALPVGVLLRSVLFCLGMLL